LFTHQECSTRLLRTSPKAMDEAAHRPKRAT